MYFLQTIWETFCALLGWLWQVASAFGSYLGISEGIAKYAIYIAIIVLLAFDPLGVSNRDKRMAKRTVNVIVDIVNRLRK